MIRGSFRLGFALVLYASFAALFLVMMPSAGNTVVLDEYNQGAQTITVTPPNGYASDGELVPNVIIGGTRFISQDASNLAAFAQAYVTGANPGVYGWSIPPSGEGSGWIYYTGNSDNDSCFGPVNLYTGDYAGTQFYIDPIFSDDNFTMCMDVYTGAGCSGGPYTRCFDFGVSGQRCANPPGSGEVACPKIVLPYNTFTPNPGTAFTSVSRVVLRWVQSTRAVDFEIAALGDNCTIGPPSIAFSATPLVVTPLPGNTNLTWNITNGNLQRADIINGCVSPSQTTTNVGASGSSVSYPVEVVPPGGCEITLKAIGQCDNNTDSVRINSEPSKVPSLNEWGMIILSLILAASAVWLVRRKRTS